MKWLAFFLVLAWGSVGAEVRLASDAPVMMGGDGYAYAVMADESFRWMNDAQGGLVQRFNGIPHTLMPVPSGVLVSRWQEGIWLVRHGIASRLLSRGAMLEAAGSGGESYIQVITKQGDRSLVEFYLFRDDRLVLINDQSLAPGE